MIPLSLFTHAKRLGYRGRDAAMQLGFIVCATFLEGLGLAILLPVFQYVQADGDVAALTEQARYWRHVVEGFAALGLEVSLAGLLGVSLASITLRQVFVYFRLVYTARLLERLSARTCAAGFEALVLAHSGYHDTISLGGVVNDLTTELRRAVAAISAAVQYIGFVILLAFYAMFLLSLSAAMTAAALGALAVAAVALRGITRKSSLAGKRVTEANRVMSEFLVERLRAVRLVRLAGTERAEIDSMRALTDDQRRHTLELQELIARMDVLIEPIIVAMGFTLLYVGTQYLALGIEEIGLFLVIVMRLLPVTKEAMKSRQSALGTAPSLAAVANRIGAMRDAAEGPGGGAQFRALAHSITFDHVTFSYPSAPDTPALNGLTLDIAKGTFVALVGPSGAGKSTLIDLLPRLRDPQSGRILFDGVPIDEYSVKSLRDGIAYAPQQPQIFNVTPAQHIRYGRPDATEAELRRAAELAGALGFIEALPDGWDTPLGEGGGRLSGGQRQRLDLARALVKQAPLLILDEPTSALDSESEQWFRAALARIHTETDITTIIVAHRLSTVSSADRIIVLIDGRVAKQGSHAELLAAGGWYADAFKSQNTTNLIPTDPSP